LDSNGTSLGLKGIGSAQPDESITAITKDNNDNLYITGGLGTLAELNTVQNSIPLGSTHGSDPVVIKYDNLLNYQWHYLIKAVDFTGPPVGDFGKDIAFANDKVFIGGIMNESLFRNFAPYADTLIHIYAFDAFMHQVSVTAPLPLAWASFMATDKKDFVQLDWKINDEALHFEIEKSYDAANWVKCGDVSATNNSQGSYTFKDFEHFENSMYYRIKQFANSGERNYSSIQKLTRQSLTGISIYPNPTTLYLNIQLTKSEPTEALGS
jgi:hypothetical protein